MSPKHVVYYPATGALFAILALTGCASFPSPEVAPAPEVVQQEEEASDVDIAEQYMDLGNVYYEQMRYADAIDQFRGALEINPYSDEAHASIGMANYHLGKKKLAESSFQRALLLNNRSIVARNGIAMVSEDERVRTRSLEQAIAFAPEDTSMMTGLRNNLCVVFVQSGKYDSAVVQCTRAILLDSTNAHAHYNLGFAYERQGRLDKALVEYRRALHCKPDWARVLNNMGLIYYYKSEFGYSINHYKQAIAVDDAEPTFHFNLGLAYEAVANRLRARSDRDPSADPSEWRSLFHRGANELNIYLRLKPDAPDADRIRTKISSLRQRAS